MRQSQALVMTPQLMQSIRLLQYTHTELERFIDEEIERNPLLERSSDENSGSEDVAEPVAVPEEVSSDWLAPELEWSAENISDKLDSTLENVFPDEPGTIDRLAPDLAAQWKSNIGGKLAPGESFDLDSVAAHPIFAETSPKRPSGSARLSRRSSAPWQPARRSIRSAFSRATSRNACRCSFVPRIAWIRRWRSSSGIWNFWRGATSRHCAASAASTKKI